MLRVIWAGMLAFALAGCSSIQVSQDYDKKADFSNYQHYQWLAPQDQVAPKAVDLQAKNRLVSQRIEAAMTRVLAQKGYADSAQATPDFYVTYHLVVKDKVASRPLQTTVGFGSYGYYGGGLLQFGGADVYQYEEGQLAIDILDSEKKLVWRGISRGVIEENLTPDEITRLINEAVEKVLAQFPPNK